MQDMTFIRSRQKANLLIVAANIAVFFVFSIIGNTQNGRFMLEHGANYAPLVAEGEYYRLFTSMFLHFGFEHLVYNMMMLIFMGDILEKTAGKVRYLLIYFGGGVAGNIVSCVLDLQRRDYPVSAGASGAIFAVIGALVYIVIKRRGNVEGISGKRLILMAGLSIAQGLTEAGIDNSAHIGGFIGGFLLAAILRAAGRKSGEIN